MFVARIKSALIMGVLAIAAMTTGLSDVHATGFADGGGYWVNEYGSELYVDSVHADGSWTGRYVNKAAGYGCQNSPFPVQGYVNGVAIGFIVNWQNGAMNCNSVTAWAGYLEVGKMVTNWNLGISGSTTILQGSDTFTYTPQKSMKLQ